MVSAKPNSPWISLIILLGLTLVCTFVGQLIVLIIAVLGSGDLNLMATQGAGGLMENKATVYWMLGVSSLGTFLLPALLLQQVEKKQGLRYWRVAPLGMGKYLIVLSLFLLACNPLMELISAWNLDMRLPEVLRSVEQWMRRQEDQMALLTEQLVMVTSTELLLVNLLVMAVIPAIAEEVYFRGAVQQIMTRLFAKEHIAIWITAIIFSAIHVQFYGFFPRMILGLIFGYAFFWTRNIWIPIFGHFLNNATVTVLAFVYASRGKSFEDLQQAGSNSTTIYIISFFATCALGYYFYKISQKEHERKLG